MAKQLVHQKKRAATAVTPPPDTIPNMSKAEQLGQAKRQRHADLYAAGAISIKDIYDERRAEYAEHIAGMSAADRALLKQYADRMTAFHGEDHGTFQLNVLPWSSIFMVGRWGEEVAHWPKALTADDKARLENILNEGGKQLKRVLPLAHARRQLPDGAYLFGPKGLVGRESAPTSAQE